MSSKLGKLMRASGVARLATYLLALWKLFKHPQTPRPAKLVAIAVLAYVVSPIDLIPDVIPILGQLDDLTIIASGVVMVTRLTPKPQWEARLREAEHSRNALSRLGWWAVTIGLLCLLVTGLALWYLV